MEIIKDGFIDKFLSEHEEANHRNVKIEIHKEPVGTIYSVSMGGYINPYRKVPGVVKTFCFGQHHCEDKNLAIEQAYLKAMASIENRE